MRLLLIRHAETADNERQVIASVLPGPVLTDRGRAQAEALADLLVGEGVDAVFSSEAVRAVQTAAPLAHRLGLPVTVLPGLHEITGGDFEGRGDEAGLRGYVGTILSWWQDTGARIPGGESGDEFAARFWGAIGAVEASGAGTAAVLSHSGSIMTWACSQSLNLDEEFSRTHSLGNTGVVRLEGSRASGWTVTRWQDEVVA